MSRNYAAPKAREVQAVETRVAARKDEEACGPSTLDFVRSVARKFALQQPFKSTTQPAIMTISNINLKHNSRLLRVPAQQYNQLQYNQLHINHVLRINHATVVDIIDVSNRFFGRARTWPSHG
jgi:hypothetical protein